MKVESLHRPFVLAQQLTFSVMSLTHFITQIIFLDADSQSPTQDISKILWNLNIY
jgi:hypothetical protein